jgi:hypothetical protein
MPGEMFDRSTQISFIRLFSIQNASISRPNNPLHPDYGSVECAVDLIEKRADVRANHWTDYSRRYETANLFLKNEADIERTHR